MRPKNDFHLKIRDSREWEILDQEEDAFTYSSFPGSEAWELNLEGDFKVTVLSSQYEKGNQYFYREQAIHEVTGVQVGYLFGWD